MARSDTPPVSLIVVDDFLDDPERCRREALATRYELVGRGLRYRDGAVPKGVAEELVRKTLRIVGGRFRTRIQDVAFRQYFKADERANRASGSWIHFDRFRWIGIVYLNLPGQCRGGTSFFSHRTTGIARWMELCEREESVKARVFGDAANMERWQESLQVTMVYNRFVLFDSRMFHQAPCYFGSRRDNARTTLNIFIDQVPDARMLREQRAVQGRRLRH